AQDQELRAAGGIVQAHSQDSGEGQPSGGGAAARERGTLREGRGEGAVRGGAQGRGQGERGQARGEVPGGAGRDRGIAQGSGCVLRGSDGDGGRRGGAEQPPGAAGGFVAGIHDDRRFQRAWG